MNINKKKLIAIVGPTASGKTNLAIDIANYYDCEIISADSRQFYQEMNIGTAKPSENQLIDVKHHFINNLSVTDNYTVGDYKDEVNAFLNLYFNSNDYVVMVGGSGLFIDAVIDGIDDFPKVPKSLRNKINSAFESKGIEYLKDELKKLDPKYYKIVDLKNHRRIIRALEVCCFSDKPYSSFLNSSKKNTKNYDVIIIGLCPRKDILEIRINNRVDEMINNGLVKEVKSLLKYRYLNPLNTVGYKELFEFFDGLISLEDAIELIKLNTRKYSKRQMTWFKKNKNILWFEKNDKHLIERLKKINN